MRHALYTPEYNISRVYIIVCSNLSMKQITIPKIVEQEVVPQSKSVGNLFEEFLTEKNALGDFDRLAENVMVVISNDGGKIFEVMRGVDGFPAKVKDILKMVVSPSQILEFRKRLAGG